MAAAARPKDAAEEVGVEEVERFGDVEVGEEASKRHLAQVE
jgi:hypothetical protein